MVSERDVSAAIGSTAYGSDGESVGTVETFYNDDRTGATTWVSLSSGLLGRRRAIAPAEDATFVDGRLQLNFKPVNLRGKVTRVEWINPHAWIHVDHVLPDGKPQAWMVEGGTPNTLLRRGINKDSLKIGEEVTVSGIRAKREDSMNVGQATITTADGRRMFAGTEREVEAGTHRLTAEPVGA